MISEDTEVSPSVANAMIRVWQLARTSTDACALSYPSTNILHPEHGVGSASGLPPAQGMTDAEHVQAIVEQMPEEMRSAFEAYYLGIIRAESIRDWGYKARWLVLGISERTYFRRVRFAREFIRSRLGTAICVAP